MTRDELVLAQYHLRPVFHGQTPVQVHQLSWPWSKHQIALVKPVTKPKGKFLKVGFDELSAMPQFQTERLTEVF